ncbi:SDR family NAD(P)-dependent oxidoreductase [Gordonia oleivorans]|uniref:SDR family NAD(P)-dependent oxidoreductase n=1 Tax=Gordonia oleivorans TaxID=3156618 RepID=UPI003CCCA144
MSTRYVLVTGAAGGIGQRVAEGLQNRGWSVIGWDIDHGRNVTEIVDLSDLTEVRSAVSRLRETTPSIEGVVHCAAVQPSGSVGSLSTDDWLAAMTVNVRSIDAIVSGLRDCMQEAQTCGSVVCIGSVHTSATSLGALPYAVSKHALRGWVKSAAVELAGSGLRVNLVSPGAVDTPMLRAGLAERSASRLGSRSFDRSALDILRSRTPIGRLGTPDDVLSLVEFLLSSDSSFVTGSDFVSDGGVLCVLSSEAGSVGED